MLLLLLYCRSPRHYVCFNVDYIFFSSLQEVREMINLPETTADMLPDDFEGIAEALKGTGTKHHHGEHCMHNGLCLESISVLT